MKKSLFVWVAGLMALAACSNNDDLLNNENFDGKMTVTATVPNNVPDSRVALTEDNTNTKAIIKVAWEDEESFSVIRGSENKTYNKVTEGNTFTGDLHDTTEGTYYGFYPTTTATTTSALPYDLSTQTGALDKAKTYMYAVNATDGREYEFKHLTALVKFSLALPDDASNVMPSKVVISSEKLQPVGTVDLTGTDIAYSTEANAVTSITVTPTALTFYAYVNPMMANSEAKNTFVISMDGNDGNYYSGTLETSVPIYANYLYAASVNMIKVEKGDYAMADGSFMKYDVGVTLTDAQKANVRGIVFWTTADMNTAGNPKTPAKLTDDAIMKADFPNCTHGLIVSLKNVSTGTKWQSNNTDIFSWQSNNTTYSSYNSITSKTGETDPINYILGYQNTKLLKAYNEQCQDANKVLPVSLLAEFETNNPAPSHTTGWFIPSVKELTLLCGTDVDDVSKYGSGGTVTKTTLHAILLGLDSNYAETLDTNSYWSSSESSVTDNHAFRVSFDQGGVESLSKESNDYYVRAVCTF